MNSGFALLSQSFPWALSEQTFSANPTLNYAMTVLVAIFVAFFILVVGYVIAVVIEMVLKRLFRRARIEDTIGEHGLSGALMGFTLTGIITAIVKWMIFLSVVVFAIEILESTIVPGGAGTLTGLLSDFVRFLPWVLWGLVLLVVGFLLADYVATRAKEEIKFHGKTVGLIVKMVIIYFTVVIVLSIKDYGLNTQLLITVFEYLALGISLGVAGAITLAVGLGLKDSVARIAKKQERALENLVSGEE